MARNDGSRANSHWGQDCEVSDVVSSVGQGILRPLWQEAGLAAIGVATEALIQNCEFDRVRSVFELGCGTGRFAERLLERYLPANARYIYSKKFTSYSVLSEALVAEKAATG